ncbi:MAG: Error-prone repair protein ImuA [Pedobacter sp.]|nr:Error-prone repair protein ImuA [Pedobacter sp.]MDQ8051882.1 Error-prone repair protein ImuA [Pedobacter sp.]
MTAEKQEILAKLRTQLLEVQGFRPSPSATAQCFGLGEIESCFPNSTFPTGTIHEFIAEHPEDAAATDGFISGLLHKLMENGASTLWISRNRKLFPPSMERFGTDAQQVVFIDVPYEKQILWTMEEALKTEGLACVIAEIPDIDFAQSRRLQLATEKSHVTGFVFRKAPKRALSATACTVRWKISPEPTEMQDNIPGVGSPRWEVTLIKVRNGHTGTFHIEWSENGFTQIQSPALAQAPEKESEKQHTYHRILAEERGTA